MTKISGKVTEKIRRILVQNFSVENCISECRVSLKKCLLCASGAETDHPSGITNLRSRDFCSFFCIRMLADVGTSGTDPAKFCGLRTLQSDKIGWNPMQFPSPNKSNPKRREPIVTNFRLLRKRLRFLPLIDRLLIVWYSFRFFVSLSSKKV